MSSRADIRFDRRVQLLIDTSTYERVAAEARASGRSVNALMREAISERYGEADARAGRARAAGRLLRLAQESDHEEALSEEDLASGHYGEVFTDVLEPTQ